MTGPRTGGTYDVPVLLTGGHPCAYLPDEVARTLFLSPGHPANGPLYRFLLDQGFRRSGDHIYRPHCDACRRCVPLRIPVAQFTPNRSQRRNLARNADVTLRVLPAEYATEHYRLYATYVRTRHAGGDMADSTQQSYRELLLAPWGGETLLLELRLEGRLLAVAVTDRVPGGLSAVYTFFDPGLGERAPGTLGVLRQIALAQDSGLDYLYLGYWIAECRKMRYKDGFRPMEAWLRGRWYHFQRGESVPLEAR